jgi:hypothetical protein
MKKVTVDRLDLEKVLDNLQYFVSYGFILDEEQTRLDQEVIDKIKNELGKQE